MSATRFCSLLRLLRGSRSPSCSEPTKSPRRSPSNCARRISASSSATTPIRPSSGAAWPFTTPCSTMIRTPRHHRPARRNRDRNRRFRRRRELRRRDAAAILRPARPAPHPRADRRPHAEALRHAGLSLFRRAGGGPGTEFHGRRELRHRGRTAAVQGGALVAEGSTEDYDGAPRPLGGIGRERFVHAPSEGVWHTPFDIGAGVARGQPLGNLGGHHHRRAAQRRAAWNCARRRLRARRA